MCRTAPLTVYAAGGACKVPNCAGIQNAFWAMLVDNLALASQGNADAGIVHALLSKLNDFLYIVQPQVCD